MSEYKIDEPIFKAVRNPELSEWKCHLFDPTASARGIVYNPLKGTEPNRFQRWMTKVFFGCVWVKE